MSFRKYGSLAFGTSICVLMFLLSACGMAASANEASQSLLTSSGSSSQPPATAVTTSCPAPGTGRAAVLPALTLGKHSNVVYTSDQVDSNFNPLSGSLKRYDTVTKQSTTIITLAHENINGVQLSTDGQWIVSQTQVGSGTSAVYMLQLVRMDGRYLQTLFCSKQAFMGGLQWSTDQKLMVFSLIGNNTQNVELLNTTSGAVQTELSVPKTSEINVKTWLDTKRIYLTNTQTDQRPNIIYILDTRKGPNQHLSDLQTVFNGSFNDFDSSYNGTQLFINDCTCGQGGDIGPSSITVQPATGGQSQTLYSNSNHAITNVRAVTPTTLLFIIDTFSLGGGVDTSQNGLWSIQTNGTGLKRLTTSPTNEGTGFNSFTQFPWSNVSRDSSMYSISNQGNQVQSLQIGPLSGGTPTTIASFNGSGTFFGIVGWTTM